MKRLTVSMTSPVSPGDRWLLVIDGSARVSRTTLNGLPEGAAVDCLLLIDSPSGRDAALRALAELAFDDVRCLDTEPIVDDVCRETRAAFIRFMAEWPTHPLREGKSFKERLTLDPEPALSLWWLTDCSMKDNEGCQVFDRLCHLGLLQRICSDRRYAGAVVCSADTAFRAACASALDAAGVPARVDSHVRAQEVMALALRQVGRRIASLTVLWLRWAAWLGRSDSARQVIGTSAFVVPPAWADASHCLEDRVYGNVLAEVAKTESGRPTYLCTLSDSLRHLRGVDTSHLSWPVVPLESYLTLRAMLRATFDVRPLWRCLVLDRELCRHAVVHGVSIGALLRPDLWRDLVGSRTLLYRLVADATERYARTSRPGVIVCAHDLYPIARAVYWGAQQAGVRTAAFQHAAISHMKLWHSFDPSELDAPSGMPLPDQYLFQGRLGEQIAKESGFPASRCVLVGGPRYDDWAGRLATIDRQRVRTMLGVDPHGRLAVVLLPYRADEEWLLADLAMAAALVLPDVQFVFKAHPSSRQHAMMRALVDRSPARARCAIVNDDTRALLVAADVLITTYSSTGDEAMALGKPVIGVASSVRCNMASFAEIPAAPIVYTVAGLTQAIREATGGSDRFERYRRHWSNLVVASFFQLDGAAARRAAAALGEHRDALGQSRSLSSMPT